MSPGRNVSQLLPGIYLCFACSYLLLDQLLSVNLATLVCPTNCGYCTRAYEIGADTAVLKKKGNIRPSKTRWEKCLEYIENTPQLQDIVISGGDSYYLTPDNIRYIGGRLIAMPNIKKFRFASRGLAVSPTRMLDPHDDWTNALIEVSQKAEKAGKRMALHTHFNHPNEISWITEEASRRLREAGVTVRNQSVLLRGVNDDVETMSRLIRTLSDTLRIQPVSAPPVCGSSRYAVKLTRRAVLRLPV